MAFIFARKHKRGKTWYVGYYVNGRFLRRRIGRSKTIAEKARGDIEARVERGEAGLLPPRVGGGAVKTGKLGARYRRRDRVSSPGQLTMSE